MKRWKRALAIVLFFCTIGGVIDPTLVAYAAVSLQGYFTSHGLNGTISTDGTIGIDQSNRGYFVSSNVIYELPNSTNTDSSIIGNYSYQDDTGTLLSGSVADIQIDLGSTGSVSANINNYYNRMAVVLYGIQAIQSESSPTACDHENAGGVYNTVLNINNSPLIALPSGGTSLVFDTTIKGSFKNTDIECYRALDIDNNFDKLMGILSYKMYKIEDLTPTNKDVELKDIHGGTVASAYNMLLEYYNYATKFRAEIDADDTKEATEDVQKTLQILYGIQQNYTTYYPILGELWSYKPSGQKSLEDMYDIDNYPYIGNTADVQVEDDFITTNDESTSTGMFYVINSDTGISSIDRDAVVEGSVEKSDDVAVKDYTDTMNGVFDAVNKWATSFQEEDPEEFISGGAIAAPWSSGDKAGVDSEGRAISSTAISMSDYITKGMEYSATFVPMKTNLYSPDTLAQFDEDWREEFYYKYGFMRKALYWDPSGSSVMDYYNANNKCTNTLRTVTLRDLLESNGNDIALYVDGNFYNAQEALDEGNEILENRKKRNTGLVDLLHEYVYSADTIGALINTPDLKITDILSALSPAVGVTSAVVKMFNSLSNNQANNSTQTVAELNNEINPVTKQLADNYNFDMTEMTLEEASEFADNMTTANYYSSMSSLDEHALKTGDFTQYDNSIEAYLGECEDSEEIVSDGKQLANNDNLDAIVLPSSYITRYMSAQSSYANEIVREDEGVIITNTYTAYDDYTPMLSLAFVSSIYRYSNAYSLANLVAADNPVFLASDDMCAIDDAGQWYYNTLLNYALVQNLQSAAQVDYTYVVDLDCPLYIDVFGNILTESGIVVIPAACNATLHTADFRDANVAVGLYAIYGQDYYVPLSCEGAAKAMFPFFVLDKNEGVYIINGNAITIGTGTVQYNAMSPYNVDTQDAVTLAYKSYIKDGKYTNLNWIAMVNICNEVMRGAPIENIDKEVEGLNVSVERNKAAIVAAVKLESLINSLDGLMSNTLISIPDFTRLDTTEYIVAFLIKLLMVATCAVIIIGVYRDGVSGTLGLRTLWKSLSSVALTFMAVCVIPAVFQLTYYSANKLLLQDETMRILMLNTEKYQSGIEIGMLDTYTPDNKNDMALQLDWISVPWYDQLENMLFYSTLDNLDHVKKKAYQQSPIYDNYDVELYNDGVYVSTETLFNSVSIDYTFNDLVSNGETEDDSQTMINGMYVYANNNLQTASFYSPYYAFLNVLIANVNQYNYYHDSFNYTTKYMSGNRLKTVGLCSDYFTSKSFMELDDDIMHIYEIYSNPNKVMYDHGTLFTPAEVTQFEKSLWYNTIDDENLYKRVELMNNYARDFIADNKDLLTRVSDETFLKVMALHLSVKYNQIFGIWSANAVEIYNMDSNDLLRLSIVPADEAVLASPMSYSRFVYNFGGESAVYAAAILTVIMWVGSFIKPLCTIIVFFSVFLSIWVFRVVLRKPSANLLGYLITVSLLCATNILHAVILKISTYLPTIGLPPLGCLIFIIAGQVIYLLVLGYVTGVSLKDWSNLGYTEYEREARIIKRKFGKNNTSDTLNGNIKHHDDNWDYYNDLVEQHRSRNV